MNEWNKLNNEIRNSRSLNIFKTSILSKKKKIFYFLFMIHLIQKLLTGLRLKFIHLSEHKLDMVLMIQLIQCVHAELKLKLLNISSCDVIFTLP